MWGRPIIATDLDECVFDNFVAKLLELYNAKYNDNLVFSNITDYNINKFLKPECKNIFQEFADDSFIHSLSISQGTIEFLKWANEYGELVFITAGHPNTIKSRHSVLAKNLDFYNSKYLWRGENKKLLKCDYLIDDCIDNLKGNFANTICINRPWNKTGYVDLRVDGFFEIKKYILEQERGRGNEC
ncbi:MAG: hypothetical protein RR322_01780 [Oscillospiraceae bacterium]